MISVLLEMFCRPQTGAAVLGWPPTLLLIASHHLSINSFSSVTIVIAYLSLLWGFSSVTRVISLADMSHDHMSSTWCAHTVSCELNKERTGRVLALFLWERDVPGGRRFGFWLDCSLAQALRGCDPQSLAEPWALAICFSPGYYWAGLWSNALYVTASGEYHANKIADKQSSTLSTNSVLFQATPSVNLTFLDGFE